MNEVTISGEFITLGSLFKYLAITSSGAEAKILIQGEGVIVNGEQCFTRGKKLYPGDRIVFQHVEYVLIKPCI